MYTITDSQILSIVNSIPQEEIISEELKRIHVPELWQDTQGEQGITSIIDTGVDYNHPDLKDKQAPDPKCL